MKTAMQLAINHFDSIDNNMHLSTTQIKYILSQYLPQERINIIQAFNDGHHADVGHVDKAWEYYNQTYNQNK
jgi:hypothetical protein